MRLIDADALIDQIEKNKCEPCKIRGHDRKGLRCRFCQYGDEMDDIYDAPTIEPQEWIPCSERLPEENQICIVTDETMRDTYEYRFCKETYDEIQGWTYLRHRIIAWMPLPEPYGARMS